MSDIAGPPKHRGFARWRRTPYGKGVLTGLGLWVGLWFAYWVLFESGYEYRVVLVYSEFDEAGGNLYRLDRELLQPQYVGGGMTIYWPVRSLRQTVALTEVIGHLPWLGPPPTPLTQEITATTKPCFVELRRTANGFAASECFVFRAPM
jgi:hypothetical protein